MANGLEKKTISSVPLSNFILSGINTSRPARANQILLSSQFFEVYDSTYPGRNSTKFYTEMLCPQVQPLTLL